MKKIIFILIGIIIGSFLTLMVQTLHSRNKPSYAVAEGIKKNLGATNVKDLSTDELFIHGIEGPQLHALQVVLVKHPEMFIFIDLQDGGINQLAVHDKNDTFASFMDKDSDGIWDFRDFSADDITYAYGKGTGYPDTILNGSNATVRIGGQYYELLWQNEKSYIMLDGKQVEIEGAKWGYYKIKKSEPAE
jgi:hypothetical protein